MVTVQSNIAHSCVYLTVYLAIEQCAFVTMHGGSAVTFFFSRTGSSFLLKLFTTQSFIKQKMTLIQVFTGLECRISGFFMTG